MSGRKVVDGRMLLVGRGVGAIKEACMADAYGDNGGGGDGLR